MSCRRSKRVQLRAQGSIRACHHSRERSLVRVRIEGIPAKVRDEDIVEL